jgi:sugar phosphate isomerase/epimerase
MIGTRKKMGLGRIGLPLLMAVAGAGALASCESSPQENKAEAASWRSGMSIQIYSFHNDIERDLPGTLARIKALGFDRVETYPVKGVSAAQMRAALDAAGLKAVSAHMPWDRIQSDLPGVIADARTLGVEQFGPGSINMYDGRPFRSMPPAEADEAGAVLKKACAAARGAGMRVFIHTHGNEFGPGGSTTPLDRMLQASGQCFDIEADIYWIQWGGADPAALIRKYGKRVSSLHLKDLGAGAVGAQPEAIGSDSHPILGQGKIDLPAVMRAAKAAGVRHYIIEDESADPAGQIPQSLRYLDSLEG